MAAYPLPPRTPYLRHCLARQSENLRRRARAMPCDQGEPPDRRRVVQTSKPRLISVSHEMPPRHEPVAPAASACVT